MTLAKRYDMFLIPSFITYIVLQETGRSFTSNEWGFLNYVIGALLAILAFLIIWGVRELVAAIKANTIATTNNTNLLIHHEEKINFHDEKIDAIADDIHDIKTTLKEHEKRLPR